MAGIYIPEINLNSHEDSNKNIDFMMIFKDKEGGLYFLQKLN